MRAGMRRYSLSALVEASGLSEAALARRVGLSGTTLKKARLEGLREDAADRYACRAGLLPWLVWPHWIEEANVECLECSRGFVPTNARQVVCSQACRQRRYRNERKTDPAWREAQRLRSRAYYESAARVIVAKKRARIRARREAAA
jgi:lambda repressor-like predicted transcriptional regulator